jgi:hypothetical protein
MAAPAYLATSAEVLPRGAPIIPPGSCQQKVSSGLLCERQTLLKNPDHLTGINTISRPEWHLVKAQQKRVLSNGFSGHAAFLRRQPPNR